MSVPNPATTKWVPLWNTGSVGASSGLLTGDLVWSVLATRGGAVPCDGATYNSVTDPSFASLYAAIGTSYGGTGPDAFKVPDVRGRVLVCKGTNPDVDAAGKNDGDTNPANRSARHNHSSALTWAGAFAGVYANTTDQSGDHSHGVSGNTGYVSSDHTHQLYTWFVGYGGTGQGAKYQSPGATFEEPSTFTGMRGISANHTHGVSITSGGVNAGHVHGFTPTGSVSGGIGGTIGTTGAHPADTPSYIVENCFIVK